MLLLIYLHDKRVNYSVLRRHSSSSSNNTAATATAQQQHQQKANKNRIFLLAA